MIIIFIRQKIIYNRPYAYLVSTRWDKRSKKVKQKVSRYLGKIIRLEKVEDTGFLDYYPDIEDIDEYVKHNPIKDIVKDLVELELYRHGFSKQHGRMMINDKIKIEINRLPTMDGVFSMNEGFLAKETIKEILDFEKIFQKAEKRHPFDFAALYVNAGIDIDKRLFISLYKRFFSVAPEQPTHSA